MDRAVFTIPPAAGLCAGSRWPLRNRVTSGELKASDTSGEHYGIIRENPESFITDRGMNPLVCRRLHTQDHDTAGTEIIVISGSAAKENRLRIPNCGAGFFPPKPLNIKILKQTVTSILA